MKRVLFLLSLIVITINSAYSQLDRQSKDNGLHPNYSIFANYALHDHRAFIKEIEGIKNCCPQYENGSGKGFSVGFEYEIPLPYSLFLGLRFSYNDLNGEFSSIEPTLVKIDSNVVNGMFEHSFKAKLADIAVEPILSYELLKNLKLTIGGHIGYMLTRDYEQKEQIVEPSDRGVFPDSKSRIRNNTSGSIPDSTISTVYGGLLAGISYELPMNSKSSFLIVPEIYYHYGLTNILHDVDWKIHTIRAGIKLKYSPKPDELFIPDTIRRFKREFNFDTIRVVTDNIDRNKFVTGVPVITSRINFSNDTLTEIQTITRTDTFLVKAKPVADFEHNVPSLNIKAQFVSEAFQMLPIVFFDNSTKISKFYKLIDNPEQFQSEKLESNSFILHKNVLNILGDRLSQFSNAIITLKGYSDSKTEQGICELAEQRAETVKNYLVNIWKIEPDRIKIAKGNGDCTPEQETTTQNDSGYAENRRVEITSDYPDLFSPIIRKRFLEVLEKTPSAIIIDPRKSKIKDIDSWAVLATQGDSVLFSHEFKGELKEFRKDISDPQAVALSGEKPIKLALKIQDKSGLVDIIEKDVSVVKDTFEVEVQRLSLILFEVTSDKIPENAKKGLIDFVTTRDEGTQIRVTGYTDILGNPVSNQSLSERRAANTVKFIKQLAPDIKIINSVGVASTKYPPGISSYSTAAERFLSRTVQIEILKKIK